MKTGRRKYHRPVRRPPETPMGGDDGLKSFFPRRRVHRQGGKGAVRRHRQDARAGASDGVSVAYCVVGQGPPLVYVCGWPQHLEIEWQSPLSRGWLNELASTFSVVRYDMRGTGLSDRDVSDFSLEASVGETNDTSLWSLSLSLRRHEDETTPPPRHVETPFCNGPTVGRVLTTQNA